MRQFELDPADLADEFPFKGSFIFSKGNRLKRKCNRVPNEHGVYLIWSTGRNRRLLYVGKAGGFRRDGVPIEQGLSQRITNKHGKRPTQDWLETKMDDLGLKSVRIQWHVTVERDSNVIPIAVEGSLLQWCAQNKIWPRWNRTL